MGIVFGILGVTVIVMGISLDGSVLNFFDPASALFVIGGSLFFSLAYHSKKSVIAAFRTAFGRDTIPETDAQAHIVVLSSVRVITSASGVLGSLIGLVKMLANMDDPKSIGPAMAVALLTLFYAVLIAELVIAPLIGRLRNRTEPNGQNPKSSMTVSTVTIAAIPMTLIAFFIMLNSF